MNKKDIKKSIEESVIKSVSTAANDIDTEVKSFKKANGSLGTLVLYTGIILMIFAAILLVRKTISIGASAAASEFDISKNNAASSIYQQFYDSAERKYHVSNKATINLGSIQEISKLEVYKVIESACEIQTKQEEEKGIHYWEKFRGEGIFTVDLSLAEFLLDNENHYVLIRMPLPVMTEFGLIKSDSETYLYAYDQLLKNGNYSEGNELAISFQKRGYTTIKDSISGNRDYIKKAKEAARTELINLVHLLNMSNEMSDLKVEVEFFNESSY